MNSVEKCDQNSSKVNVVIHLPCAESRRAGACPSTADYQADDKLSNLNLILFFLTADQTKLRKNNNFQIKLWALVMGICHCN